MKGHIEILKSFLGKGLEETFILSGKLPGPTSIIMAGIHGNELCGMWAFGNLIPQLTIECGTVLFVLGNPRAIRQGVRFTEFNLNRAFCSTSFYSLQVKKTYEYRRAQELKQILDKGDALLDIHSTLGKSEPFIVCEKNGLRIIASLPNEFKRIVHGFNFIEPGAADGYMLANGKIGICIECGQHGDGQAIVLAEKSITSFLGIRGHNSLPKLKKVKEREEIIQMDSIYYTKTDSFELSKEFLNFEKVAKGALIGTDGAEEKRAGSDSVIVFAHNCDKKGAEAYLLGHIV